MLLLGARIGRQRITGARFQRTGDDGRLAPRRRRRGRGRSRLKAAAVLNQANRDRCPLSGSGDRSRWIDLRVVRSYCPRRHGRNQTYKGFWEEHGG